MSEAEPEQTHEKVEDSTESITETKSEAVPEQNSIDATLFGVRTTGGQEKVVLRLLEAQMRSQKIKCGECQEEQSDSPLIGLDDQPVKDEKGVIKTIKTNFTINLLTTNTECSPNFKQHYEEKHGISGSQFDEKLSEIGLETISKSVQSILLVDNLKGYVVVEAREPQDMFNAIQGVKHVKGQLRGGLQFSEIENYLVKKSTVSELAVDGTVEIIGGPFKGMKATVTRVDHDKEEATVILLDAPYQLPVTVDANYLKPIKT